VEQAIERSGLPHTIFRSTQWHTLAWDFGEQMSKLPIVVVPKGFRLQLLDPREVAERVTSLVSLRPQGFAPEMGGPQILDLDDVVRSWLAATGHRKRVVTVPIPGKIVRAFREGGNLTPDHMDGTITWDEWLASRIT
jgi:uncharacterized protein YbjT (DUF2867 family)